MIDPNDQLVAALAGRYDIERELARGGMAVVYLARDVRHKRLVAIKVLRPEPHAWLGTDRFEREISLSAPLVHPNIVPVHDSGEAAGCLYFVMPYVEGPTLRERLTREVQLPIGDAIDIARQVAAALDHAHAHDVVHRDIKPENILLLGDHVLVADFGLARPIAPTTDLTLTNRLLVLGTPPYMSPEQCTAGGQVDGRSDIYSLACVVFEMISGSTPFRAATMDAMLAHHLTTEPPSICIDRSSCPPHLDAAVRRALAKVPADRFRTAGEFVRAMAGGSTEPRDSSPGVLVPRLGIIGTQRRRWGVAFGATLLLAALVAWFLPRPEPGVSPADVVRDTTVIALLPLELDDTVSTAGTEHLLLFEAFGRWRGISLIEPFQVNDALYRLGHAVRTDADARLIADSLGAGRYVRARATRIGDTLRVYATLYDLRTTRALQRGVVHVAVDLSNGDEAFARLTDTLLLRGVADSGLTAPGQRSLPAAQAFAIGDRALNDWDLDAAATAYHKAGVYDPRYARAFLRLAQVHAWNRRTPVTWLSAAQRALNGNHGLTDRDAQLARALVHLGSGDYASACDIYDSMRRRNDRDFAAWYGLGQCRSLDKLVVADSTSPSGWRFRSSQHQGLMAYEQALDLLPSAHSELQSEAFKPLRDLLLTGRDQLVSGYRPDRDTARYLARIASMGDTLALIPYPWEMITGGGAAVYPPGFDRAVTQQRNAFHRIALTWSLALPHSAGAKEALAVSLEMLGDRRAIDTLRAARRLATDPTRQTQLAAAEALLRVKFALPDRVSDLRIARLIADSLLAGDSAVTHQTARAAAAMAELTGRCGRAVELARTVGMAQMTTLAIAAEYYSDAAELLVRTAMGCRAQAHGLSLDALAERLRRDPAFAGPNFRRVAEDVLLYNPAQLSFPPDRDAIGALASNRPRSLIGALHALAAGDTSRARTTIAGITRSRGSLTPSVDVAYPESRLLTTLGDTAGALTLLRSALDGARSAEPRSFAAPAGSATLVRAIALLAELEHTHGDRRRARAWASAVAELWRDADDELQPVVRSMQRYARP